MAAARARQQLVAPFIYPQLYRCLDPEAVRRAAQGLAFSFDPTSQSREDIFLWQNIFSQEGSAFAGSTYVEIGALDGLQLSNTYKYEQLFDARGLLIEAHPANSPTLRSAQSARPNSAIFTLAVCGWAAGAQPGQEAPGSVRFTNRGGAVGAGLDQAAPGLMQQFHSDSANDALQPQVDCIPLQAIIDSTGLLDIDFFSLGEGEGCRLERW
jgi:hypothetical protein